MFDGLPQDWAHASLEECLEALIDYRGKSPLKTSFGVPLVTAKVVKGGRIETGNTEYISASEYATWMRRGIPRSGDVLLTSEAPLGEVAQLTDATVALAQRLFTLRGASGRLDNTFLKFFLMSSFAQSQLQARATGTTVLGIRQSELRRVVVTLPPFAEQKRIALILGSLDDKIELNRRTSETLEAMARALFKSWFVDFDPVRAKSEGRKPAGMDAETAKLFPDGFHTSPRGSIPVGWRLGVLRDIAHGFNSGRVPLSAREREQRVGTYPYYGAASVVGHVDGYLFDGVHILVGEDGSVVTADGSPVLQYVWGKFWVNNHAHVLKGTCGVSDEHLLLLLRSVDVRPYVTGAAQPKLNQGNLFQIPVCRAPESVCRAFGNTISPLYARLRVAAEESATLAELRDTLLPKLMSGELRIKDAEKIASASL